MRFSECSLGSGASFRGPWRHLTILGRGYLRASAPLSFTEAWAGPSRSGRIQRPLGKSAAEGFLSGVALCILVLRRIPESRAATSDPSLWRGPEGVLFLVVPVPLQREGLASCETHDVSIQ